MAEASAADSQGDALVMTGSARAGWTSNADGAFDPRASPFVRLDQSATWRGTRGAYDGAGLIRARLDDPVRGETVEYADLEARLAGARRFGEEALLGAAVGYRFEADRFVRKGDLGAGIEGRAATGRVAPFFAVTANQVAYEPLRTPFGAFDMGDADRLRLRGEVGIEAPMGAGAAAFVAAGATDIRHDRPRDLLGFARSSRTGFARMGVRAAGATLAASGSATVRRRVYDDPRFAAASVLTGEAEIAWRPVDGTAFGLRYVGDLEQTVLYGVSDVLSHAVVLSLARRLTPSLVAGGAVYAQTEDYLGAAREDLTRGASLDLARALRDDVTADLGISYERRTGTLFDGRIETWKVTVGLSYALAR